MFIDMSIGKLTNKQINHYNYSCITGNCHSYIFQSNHSGYLYLTVELEARIFVKSNSNLVVTFALL